MNALQLAIDQLLSNKQIMADKAIAAANYVKEYCSLDNQAAALAKIYKQYLVSNCLDYQVFFVILLIC